LRAWHCRCDIDIDRPQLVPVRQLSHEYR
jgi:hypothetical protein